MITVLGLAAGAFTTLSFLPQVARTARTRSAGDVSWGWLLLFATGVGGWLVYGVITADLPIVITNSVTFMLVGMLTALKARHDLIKVRADDN